MDKWAYNPSVPHEFTIGDMIRKARRSRRWSQTKLGNEAARFTIDRAQPRINKSTVSKVENAPYSSELGTVWRLMAALGLTFCDVEGQIESPVVERGSPREALTPARRPGRRVS